MPDLYLYEATQLPLFDIPDDAREVHNYQRFHNQRMAARLLQVVDLLFSRPVVTIAQVADAAALTYQSTARHIDALVEEGVLTEITGQARNRIFRADAVIETIDAPIPLVETKL